ncbi:MAG TPA: hypothetical protein VGL18_17085 [Actinomycetota bacterium]
MSWGRFRLVLGVVFVISGFAMASRLSNPRYPQNGFQGVERQASLLIPILIGAVLIWWGRGFSILYLFSLALVLGGLAVALWGPEWGPACRPHEACLAVAYSLPGIWVASVVATGALLGLVAFMDGRRISRSRSS